MSKLGCQREGAVGGVFHQERRGGSLVKEQSEGREREEREWG